MNPQTDFDELESFRKNAYRRKGFPSETKVERGQRSVRGEKELIEKLGRNDRD